VTIEAGVEVLMQYLTWEEFQRVKLKAGTIIDVQDFPEARKPAFKLKIDFGPEVGIKTSSAQVTDLYTKSDLLGRQVIAVVDLAPKRIGPVVSECLVTGFQGADGSVVLAVPEREVPNGARIF
jgi:tRNA-binding protein